MTRITLIDPLIWPDDIGSGGQLRVISGITDWDMTRLIGSLDSLIFRWGE